MTSPKNSITFPILDTFLKLISDREWHNCHIIRNKWKQLIPPEYFARRKESNPHWSTNKGKIVSFTRTIDSVISRSFKRTVMNSIESGYVEIRELGVKRLDNYEIKITDNGMLRFRDKVPGFVIIDYQGEKYSLSVFCKKMDLVYNKFRFWFYRKKVNLDEAILKSKKGVPRARAKLVTHNGETKPVAEWCRILNLRRQMLDYYLVRTTVEEAIERSKR